MKRVSRRLSSVYSAPALEKGLDILEALAAAEAPQSLSELAHALGRSSSELFRALSSLEERSYAIRDPASGRYRLSLKLYELSHSHPPVEQLLKAGYEPMHTLARSLGQPCHLSVMSEGKLLVLAEAMSPGKVRLSIAVGASFATTRTASGRLLLAGLPQEECQRVLDRNPDYRKQSESQKRRLRATVCRIRKAGYSTAVNETYMGIRDVAVAVGSRRIGLASALAISFWTVPGKPFELDKVLGALRTCAGKITQSMGVSKS